MTRARRKQGGYALLLVVFLTSLLVVGTMSIGLRILTQGRREKEQEMIWRGKQYTRGIKLYYRKLGRFPNSMDDLVKPKIGSLRFMRQAYKDPMNKEDGSWRLIYVGPAGNLIGSLKPPQGGIQMPAAGGQPGVAAAGSSFGSFGSQPATPAGGIAAPGAAPGTPGAPSGATGTGTGAQGTDTAGTGSDPQAVPTGDMPTIMGGNIIGVGGKVNKSSIMVYEKAQNYRLFEFIWDPSKDMGAGAAPGSPIGAPTGAGAPGQNPIGAPANPLNPPPSPPTAAPNPNPTQP
ncbi:MAG TPA: hypothetical protein VJW94_02415 [Candidatus Acidoferrum sp.]|nr:hypothetical protein [Candidatus Acidoferrum sp.]